MYVAEGLSYLPPLLSANYAAKRGMAKENISEILVADLGDNTSSSPFLIVSFFPTCISRGPSPSNSLTQARHSNNDVTMYQPFRLPTTDAQDVSRTLHFQKLPNSTFARDPEKVDEDEDDELPRAVPMRRCDNIAGYKTVFIPGDSPSFIFKSSKTLPKVIGLQGKAIRGMSSFHTEGCERGFIFADSKGTARVSQIPASDTTYADIGMSLRKLPMGVDAHTITHHPPSGMYVAGCDVLEPFELPKEDDYHKEWQYEKDLTFKPMAERGLIKLLNPSTWTAIDTVEMDPCEVVMCVETLNLEVSESTHELRHLIAVGTAIARGEDLPTKGRVYVYDVVTVIPEPGRPETDRRLKLVAREEIPRGAVTALSEIGTQGLMLVAQGQKCMVRGLKEDGTLLPVAFMDMNCHVTAVRELRGTGLCLLADAVKGLWFTGYTEEPYKMMLFGKSATRLEVLSTDFLPDGDDLLIVACDADGAIHVLQFDPEREFTFLPPFLLYALYFKSSRIKEPPLTRTSKQIPSLCRATCCCTGRRSQQARARPRRAGSCRARWRPTRTICSTANSKRNHNRNSGSRTAHPLKTITTPPPPHHKTSSNHLHRHRSSSSRAQQASSRP